MKQFEQQIDKTIDSLAHITTHFQLLYSDFTLYFIYVDQNLQKGYLRVKSGGFCSTYTILFKYQNWLPTFLNREPSQIKKRKERTLDFWLLWKNRSAVSGLSVSLSPSTASAAFGWSMRSWAPACSAALDPAGLAHLSGPSGYLADLVGELDFWDFRCSP